MSWNSRHEAIVAKWAEYSAIRATMHHRTASWYERAHYVIGPLTVVVSSVSLITQFANISATTAQQNNSSSGGGGGSTGDNSLTSMTIAVIVLTILGSILSGLQTFFRFDKTSTQHRSAAAKYESLQRDIEEHLTLDPQDRLPANEFLKTAKNTLNSLSALNLGIPSVVLNRYVNELPPVVPKADEPQVVVAEVPADDDFQDEYAEEIRRQLQQRQLQVETFQLSRLNTTVSGAASSI